MYLRADINRLQRDNVVFIVALVIVTNFLLQLMVGGGPGASGHLVPSHVELAWPKEFAIVTTPDLKMMVDRVLETIKRQDGVHCEAVQQVKQATYVIVEIRLPEKKIYKLTIYLLPNLTDLIFALRTSVSCRQNTEKHHVPLEYLAADSYEVFVCVKKHRNRRKGRE